MLTRHTRLAKTREHLKTHGLLRTIHRCGYSMIKHSYPYLTMNCIWADLRELNVPNEEVGYDVRRLSQVELLRFAQNPSLSAEGLTPEVIPVLLDHGDECFGVLDGSELAAFCWYSTNPPARINDLWAVDFAPSCVYVYFVYTTPQYRGRRLLAHGIKVAGHEYLKRGYKNVVAFVEFANYSSLRAFFRMGFEEFGRTRILRAFGRNISVGGRGCKRFGFRVVPNPSPLAREPARAMGPAKPVS